MAGIAFVIAKKTAMESIKGYQKRSFYLDLYNQYRYLEETGQTPLTPPVQVVYALRQAIREYFEEGEVQRNLRYTKNAKVLRSGLVELGFSFLLREELESDILLTVLEPDNPNFNFDRMHDYLYQRGFTIYPGKIRQKSFRLATMGAIYPEDILAFLQTMKQYLEEDVVQLKPVPGTGLR